MRRRGFLQLAATAAAATIVQSSRALTGWSHVTAGDGVRIEMLLEKLGGRNHWTINGRSFMEMKSPFLQPGIRYRVTMLNATGTDHTVTLPRHRFELRRVNQIPVSAICEEAIRVEHYNAVEADLVLTRPATAMLFYPKESVIVAL